jgi:hypothetical protein
VSLLDDLAAFLDRTRQDPLRCGVELVDRSPFGIVLGCGGPHDVVVDGLHKLAETLDWWLADGVAHARCDESLPPPGQFQRSLEDRFQHIVQRLDLVQIRYGFQDLTQPPPGTVDGGTI